LVAPIAVAWNDALQAGAKVPGREQTITVKILDKLDAVAGFYTAGLPALRPGPNDHGPNWV
jgi:glycyl-tRNA synthetase beta subunit